MGIGRKWNIPVALFQCLLFCELNNLKSLVSYYVNRIQKPVRKDCQILKSCPLKKCEIHEKSFHLSPKGLRNPYGKLDHHLCYGVWMCKKTDFRFTLSVEYCGVPGSPCLSKTGLILARIFHFNGLSVCICLVRAWRMPCACHQCLVVHPPWLE